MLSKSIKNSLNRGSWVRKTFENRALLIDRYGIENVYDFSLGNPIQEPPPEIIRAIKSGLERKGVHQYMDNRGFPEVREKIAERLRKEFSLDFRGDHITMCCGAGGGLNVVFKTLLNPLDEIIVLAPYFPEYMFYAENYSAIIKSSQTNSFFEPDLKNLEELISLRTKIVLINSPNNPTGKVYSQEAINAIGVLVKKMEHKYQKSIYLVSDEPYRKLLFDGAKNPNFFAAHKNAILVNSHSKDYGLAGQRIGYIALAPDADYNSELQAGMGLSNRILGFVNAPALMQIAITESEEIELNFDWLEKIRDEFYEELTKVGFKMEKPKGAFYFFPEIPINDDIKFARLAQEKRILLVPGSGFGRKKHVRISYSVDKKIMRNSIPAFQELMASL